MVGKTSWGEVGGCDTDWTLLLRKLPWSQLQFFGANWYYFGGRWGSSLDWQLQLLGSSLILFGLLRPVCCVPQFQGTLARWSQALSLWEKDYFTVFNHLGQLVYLVLLPFGRLACDFHQDPTINCSLNLHPQWLPLLGLSSLPCSRTCLNNHRYLCTSPWSCTGLQSPLCQGYILAHSLEVWSMVAKCADVFQTAFASYRI